MLMIFSVLAVVAGIAIPLLFISLALKGNQASLIAYLAFVGIWELALAFFVTYNFGSFFPGPGTCIAVFSLPIALFSVIALRWRRNIIRENLGEDQARHRLYLAGMILIPLLQIVPPIGAYALTGACNEANRQLGEEIVAALDRYANDHGGYPDELEALVPDYLAEVPAPRCFAPFAWASLEGPRTDTFELHTCDDVTVLMAPVLGDSSFSQRYNLATDTWRTKVSFLDGACSYLE